MEEIFKYSQIRLFTILFILIISLSTPVFGQYDVRTVGRVEDLKSASITCIDQDRDGFVWIGTTNGLYRFDGYELKEYKSANVLGGKDVMALLIDSKDRMWVGLTDGGLSLYDRNSDSFQVFESSTEQENLLTSNDVRSLHEDESGRIWVATNHALNLFREETGDFKVYGDLFEDILLKDIKSDQYGDIWCGTFDGGLYQFSPGSESFKAYLTENPSTYPKIQSINFDGDQLYIGTRNEGLLIFDTKSKKLSTFFETNSPYFNSNIRAVFFDVNTEKLFLGTDGDGLLVFQRVDGKWIEQPLFKKPAVSKLLSNSIYAVFIDRDENLWMGSAWEGVYILESLHNPIQFMGDSDGEDLASVWSIYAEENQVLLGTDGNGVFVHERVSEGQKGNVAKEKVSKIYNGLKIVTIKKRKDGKYWLGTYSNGLILLDQNLKEIKRYKSDLSDNASLSANEIRDILEDRNGGYWIATWAGGLNYFDEKSEKFTVYKYDSRDVTTISNNNVMKLEYALDGKIWVATFGGGANLLDPETRTFQRFQYDFTSKHQLTLPSKNITSIHDDNSGHLWLGTWNNGLKMFDMVNGTINSFDDYKKLNDITICGILQDEEKNIWINSVESVFKYDVKNDTVYEFPDLNGSYQFSSIHRSKQGVIYYGGLNGVVSFEPTKMKHQTEVPKVVLTDFKVFNKPVENGIDKPYSRQINDADLINLNYDQRVITFDFAAIKFPTSQACQYAIKMDNFDKDWRDNGSNRSATYTNLSPGKYTFKVRAYNEEGSVSGNTASIPIVIAKPLWATWWAYLIYLALFMIMLYFYRLYSIYWEKMKSQLKLEQLNREKETELHEVKLRFFTNISHEIRTPVTLILGSVNRLMERGVTDRVSLNAVQNLKKNGTHLHNLVSELLDFRKLELGEARLKVAQGNIVKFTKEIFLSFDETAHLHQIDYKFDSPSDHIDLWFDRDEMEKVLYNLISNAFKFSKNGGEIGVEIDVDDQHAFIVIRDTGLGIPPDQIKNVFKRFYQSENKKDAKQEDGYGLGLSITYEIVKLHGGEIIVESELNQWTRFTIKMPLGNDHIRSEFLINDFKDSEELSQYESIELPETSEDKLFNFPNQSELSILIAEDNDGIRKYLHDLLSPHFKIIEAKNGAEALTLTFEHFPDLILSDVMMPEMDGITFTGKVKNDPRTSHLPIIILTARTSLIYKKEGLDTGADDYITKPFNELVLKTRIRNILHNRMLLREKYKTDLLMQPAELAIKSPEQEFLSKMTEVLEENLNSENLSTEFIARELGMSQSTIYKKLKSLTGMSIIEFIRDFRLKRAVQLIINQKLPVAEVCYQVGFSDRRYFSNVFKAKYGVTPSQYAKENLDKSSN